MKILEFKMMGTAVETLLGGRLRLRDLPVITCA
jgi:hypothetical protein